MLGADLAYCGTRFIATVESSASEAYKAMVRNSGLDDIVLTDEVTGLPASMLRPSLAPAEAGGGPVGFDVTTTLAGANGRPSRWATSWSAGHATSLVHDVPSVADLVTSMAHECRQASTSSRSAR